MNRFSLSLLTVIVLVVSVSSAQEDRQQRQSESLVPAMFRDVKLTADQQEQIKARSADFRKQLIELTEEQNQVYTREQLEARRDAARQARAQQKSNQETRQRIDEAVDLTPDQKSKLVAIGNKRREIQKSMQAALMDVLTPEQKQNAGGRDRNQGRRASRIAPTHADVSYGPHERNLMDVWLADSDRPTPVFFSIHGGGFRGGNKSVDAGLLKACLEKGISVVAITYRLSGEAIAPAQFHDSARAVQFVRSQATEWNIDKTRFASSGGSAGAGISLWLAFHDDLADAKNADPVLRESTRLKCAIVFNGQSTYDPREIDKLIPEASTSRHSALDQLYGIDTSSGFDNLPADKIKLIEECSPINHVSRGDAPVLMAYATNMDTPITTPGIGIHHPRFGKLLKEKMDPLGIECRVETGSQRGSEKWVAQTMQFLKKHL